MGERMTTENWSERHGFVVGTIIGNEANFFWGCIFGAVSIGEKMLGWLYESDKRWWVPALQSHHTSSRTAILRGAAGVQSQKLFGRMALVRCREIKNEQICMSHRMGSHKLSGRMADAHNDTYTLVVLKQGANVGDDTKQASKQAVETETRSKCGR